MHFFESLNPIEKALSSLDFRDLYYLQKERKALPDTKNLLIINTGSLSDSSIGSFREELADVLVQTSSCSPRMVAIDVLFDKNSADAFADMALLEALGNCPNLVMATDTTFKSTLPKIHKSSSGQITLCSDSLSPQRYYPLKSNTDGALIETFALQIARVTTPDITEELSKVSYRSDIEIDYRYHPWKYNNVLDTLPFEPHYFDVLEAGDILDSAQFEKIKSRNLIRDKIVVVAHIASKQASNLFDIEDRHIVPHANTEIIDKRPVSPGAFIHCEVIQMYLNKRLIAHLPFWLEVLIEYLILLLIACFFVWIAHQSIWFKPVVIPITFILCFVFIWLSLFMRDHLVLWAVGTLNLQLILLIETVEFYEPIAKWLHKKYRFHTFFSHD
jgi:CHASE2 domain-containing sensor protein